MEDAPVVVPEITISPSKAKEPSIPPAGGVQAAYAKLELATVSKQMMRPPMIVDLGHLRGGGRGWGQRGAKGRRGEGVRRGGAGKATHWVH